MLAAYRRTQYSAARIEISIGRRSAAMDALLARHAARVGVFVTAWNPMSHRMPIGWNRRMQRCLQERLRGCASLPADGSFRSWREAHFLVLREIRWVLRLARVFRQRAVVVVRPGRAACLVILPSRKGR